MRQLNKAMLAAVLALGFSTAQAFPTNTGGVVFDPDAPLDFEGTSAVISQSFVSGVFSALGSVSTLNGTGVGVFCPGCELTYQFSGFTVSSITPNIFGGSTTTLSGGTVNFYVDTAQDASASNATLLTTANTGNGTLWLSMVGHSISSVTLTQTTLVSPAVVFASGQFDVIGGLAALMLDTNTKVDGSDMTVSNTMTNVDFITSSTYTATGSGTFSGNAVPEPGTLALAGLGLLGASALRRRQQKT